MMFGVGGDPDDDSEITGADTAAVRSVLDLAQLLRRLRRREARRRNDSQLTYRELAARTGWSHAAIGVYLSGRSLAPTDRFDVLIQLLGAGRVEQGLLATARDRLEERRYCGTGDAPTDRDLARPVAPHTIGVPHMLPAPTPYFTGRHTELTALSDLLRAPGGTVLISAIGGTAGVGKTALALHWAHRIADRFPDGQLYVNLRGFDAAERVMEPDEAVRCLLEALQVPAQRLPTTLDAQTALYRSMLSGKRLLIVLDNARDTAQVRPLLPGGTGCLVLVTSRNRLEGLVATDGAHPVTLDLPAEDEAVELLARRLGRQRLAAEPETVQEIVEHCARLPLALAIVAARAAINPRLSLSAIAADLRDNHRRWTTLRGDDPATDVRAVFSWSCRALGPGAARLFRLLGVHHGPDLSAATAASIAGVPLEEAGYLLDELAHAHLVVEQEGGRFTLHDLLRAYAAQQVQADPERHTATRRMLDHYLHSGFAAERRINKGVPVVLEAPSAGTHVVRPADTGEALAWFDAEHPAMQAAIIQSTPEFDGHVWRLAAVLAVYLDRRGHWHDWTVVGHAALAASQRSDDAESQMLAHRNLSRAHTRLNRLEDARTHLKHALDLLSPHDVRASGDIHLLLSDISSRLGDNADALAQAEEALACYRSAEHPQGLADALNSVGWYHAMLGNYQQTIVYCEQAWAVQEKVGGGVVAATIWDSLGYAHHQLGDHARAIGCYRRALDLFQEVGDRYFLAETLTRLGDTHRAAGNPEQARQVWQRALEILDDLGHPDAESVRARLSDVNPPSSSAESSP